MVTSGSRRDLPSILLSALFTLILLGAIYALLSNDPGARRFTRATIFVGIVVYGVVESYRDRSSRNVLAGAALLAVGGVAGLFLELRGANGLENPAVLAVSLLGVVLVSYLDWLLSSVDVLRPSE